MTTLPYHMIPAYQQADPQRMRPEQLWVHRTIIPKEEPKDQEETDDSGISGSDLCSPKSNHSETIRYSPLSITNPIQHHRYCDLPSPSPSPTYQKNLRSSNIEVKSQILTTRIPCTSPEDNTPENNTALRQLQLAIENNDFLPSSVSPTCNEKSRGKSEADVDNLDDQTISVPQLNSHSKLKKYYCKHCRFETITKETLWDHQKSHMNKKKMLSCSKCPFVTEYKHHFHYHMRNHTGSKPFKCTQCDYACVNKSMLNSHLKSHSKIYQYSCADCRYVTKYQHALKIHLRKYKHNPAMIRNPDGTPNPLPIIDVYGTRRGPKIKFQKTNTVQENLPQPDPIAASLPFNPFMSNAPQMQLPFAQLPFLAGFPAAVPNPLLLQNLEALIRRNLELANENQNKPKENQENPLPENNCENRHQESEGQAEVWDMSQPPEQPVRKNRRKGRAFKLAPKCNNEARDEELTYMFNNVEVVEDIPTETGTREKKEDNYKCHFCVIDFGDSALYKMHISYHGFQDPLQCNNCGEECNDKVAFFVHIAEHIARNPHS